MTKLPDWSSVKHDPDARIEYHKQGFDMSLEQLENLTREMQKDASKCTTNAVALIRLIADSMVKSFNQLYYDVYQGFPGYDLMWIKRGEKVLRLTTEEHTTISNMVDFSTWHAADSMWPSVTLPPAFTYATTDEDYDWHWYKAYMQQMSSIIDARIKLGLDPLGDYGNSDSMLYPNGSADGVKTPILTCPECGIVYEGYPKMCDCNATP